MKTLRILVVLFMGLGLAACDINISTSPGSIEDMDRPKVIEDLAPLPDGYLDFALETAELFFTGGKEGIADRLHPILDEEGGATWGLLDKFASDTADFDQAEYYGHGFGQDKGLDFVVVQLKVPFDGGYNLVKMVMPTDTECCVLAGINIEAKAVKSFKFGE